MEEDDAKIPITFVSALKQPEDKALAVAATFPRVADVLPSIMPCVYADVGNARFSMWEADHEGKWLVDVTSRSPVQAPAVLKEDIDPVTCLNVMHEMLRYAWTSLVCKE